MTPAAAQATDAKTRSVYYGDLHLHTSYSSDAVFLSGIRIGLDDAYRFARGEVVDYAGQSLRRAEPLDFIAVTDHAEQMGVGRKLFEATGPLAETELPVEACEAERAARVFAPPVAAGPPPEASPRAPTAGAPEPEDAEFVLLEDEPVPSASAAPPPPRPAPTGPVRFARPLPPGCRAPGGPPPAHPGRPPR